MAREVGADGLAAMTAAFYRRVRTDDLLGPMYPEQDFEGAETRLREFLQFRFLGNQAYMENRGHPRLRMRHAHVAVDLAMRDAWLRAMTRALDARGVDGEVRAFLDVRFAEVADFLRNTPG